MNLFNLWFKQLTRPWVVVLLVIFISCSIFYLDRPLAVYLHGLNIKLKSPLLHWFSYLGDSFLYLSLLLLLAFIYRYVIRDKRIEISLWFLWLCVLFPTTLAAILKTCIGRARPQLWIEQHLYGIFGWHTDPLFQSFPSGHTTAVTGMMIGLIVIAPKYKYLWMLLAICLMITRVLLIKHFLSDVLMSSYLVFLELGLLFKFMKHCESKKNLSSDLHRLCMIAS